jgi:hypothetical protein
LAGVVVVCGRRWAAARWSGASDELDALEGVEEFVRPGPVGGDAESGAATGAGDDSGGVQEPVAQRFGLGAGEVVAAVGADRWPPPSSRDRKAGGADLFGEVEPDREPHVRRPARIDEAVGQRGGVGSGDDLDLVRVDTKLRQREVTAR